MCKAPTCASAVETKGSSPSSYPCSTALAAAGEAESKNFHTAEPEEEIYS